MKRWWMALVRGVICLSLSDWAPAVAPSLAPLHSLRPTTPHLSQMGGWMEAGRKGRGRGGREKGGWRMEEEGGSGKATRTSRRKVSEQSTSGIMSDVGFCCAVKNGFMGKQWLQKLIFRRLNRDIQQHSNRPSSHANDSQERAWCSHSKLMVTVFLFAL